MSVNTTSLSSFDANHSLYDQVRPGFDQRAIDSLLAHLNLSANATVVELASGTGKFTKNIINRGFNLIAVEPSAGMRETFHANYPDIPLLDGSSYNLPLETSSVDAIIIAQAFHWFADLTSLQEFARVLKPETRGKLVFIWNYEDTRNANLDEDSWQVQTTEYIWSFDGNVPQYRRTADWRAPLVHEDQTWFQLPYQEEHNKCIVKYKSVEDLWLYWKSRSYITAKDDDEIESIRVKFLNIFQKHFKPERDLDDQGNLTAYRGIHTLWLATI
ncbi:S-adenosyl-L-methionine-dependent methyltransferase [Nadsonia fulvescens var. elongata DSM 6958]|uniref:S-adenosyl-L-methionine-dependent methyltransferase n=1 Tax=Nadsonia fulvescens var. elongata DSM 6958 TaxID=857566 RepID=A0A1E3PHS0_9ASCO|nr:S-adenosyl-L-methionine-dependent methyltransferase [Nadsonia fulvescens var. elongata DSM 6958]